MAEASTYDIQVMSIDERRAIIDENKKSPEFELPLSEIKNNPKLPVFYVPIETPLYRMQNARTRSWQKRYVRKNDLDDTFFGKGQENVESQAAQHSWLFELSQKGNTQEQKSIYTALLESQQQTEPLLISADGVIVNGNRRLAAMRELVGDITAFRNVLVQLLPAYLGPRDLREIEGKLQTSVDFRLEYDWTDDAQLTQDLLNDNNGDYDKVAAILNKRTNQVKDIIERYQEAELYVTEVMDKSDDFEYVNNRVQDFKQIADAVRGATTTEDKDVIRAIAWPLTRHAKDAKGQRVYEYDIIYAKANRAETLEELANRLDIDLDVKPAVAKEDDLFEEPADAETPLARFGPVIEALQISIVDADEARSREIASVLREIGDEMIELSKDKTMKSLALKQILRAARIISSVKPDKADPEQHQEIIGALNNLEASTQGLRRIVEGLSGGA